MVLFSLFAELCNSHGGFSSHIEWPHLSFGFVAPSNLLVHGPIPHADVARLKLRVKIGQCEIQNCPLQQR